MRTGENPPETLAQKIAKALDKTDNDNRFPRPTQEELSEIPTERFERLESLTTYMFEYTHNIDPNDWLLYNRFQAIYRFPEQLKRQTNLLLIELEKQKFFNEVAEKVRKFLRRVGLNLHQDRVNELADWSAQEARIYLAKILDDFDIRIFLNESDKNTHPKRLTEALIRRVSSRAQGFVKDQLRKIYNDIHIQVDQEIKSNPGNQDRDETPEIQDDEDENTSPWYVDQEIEGSTSDEDRYNPQGEAQRILNQCRQEVHHLFTEFAGNYLEQYPTIDIDDLAEWVLLKYFLGGEVASPTDKADEYGINRADFYNIYYIDGMLSVIVYEAILKIVLIPESAYQRCVTSVQNKIEESRLVLESKHPANRSNCNVYFLCLRLLPMYRPAPEYTPLSFEEIADELSTLGCQINAERIRKFWYSRDVRRTLSSILLAGWSECSHQEISRTLRDYIQYDPENRLKPCFMPRRSEIHAQFLAIYILYEHKSISEIYDLLHYLHPGIYLEYNPGDRTNITNNIHRFWEDKVCPLIEKIAQDHNYPLPQFPQL